MELSRTLLKSTLDVNDTCGDNESISEMTKTIDVEQSRRNKEAQQEGFLGSLSLPSQVCRKAVKKGFEFVLLVVG